jgi:hypothetical protein
MRDCAKKKRCFSPISVVFNDTHQENHRMMTIGKIPQKLTVFFRPLREHFSKRAWPHFWGLVLAMAMGSEHTLKQLNALLRQHTHRTKDGEFLWCSHWDEGWVVREMALDTLKRLHRKGEPLYFIVDETQTLKRAKKMQAVGKLYHHSSKRYGTGHTILKASLWYRGVTIPWGSWLYVKKEDAATLKKRFVRLTELAAEAIRQANLPQNMNVTVLFDSYYLCPVVVQAVQARKWHYIGVAKSNRRFKTVHSHRLSTFGPNVLRRDGKWKNVKGLNKTRAYCVADRIGQLKKLGQVKVVFSRRRGDRKTMALVTNDLARSARRVVADYLLRWSIELLIKDEKQQLGLGDYRVTRYRAVVRHLHLVDAAYACLTHLGIKTHGAKGHNKTKRVLQLPTIRQLKQDLQQAAWRDAAEEVVKVSHERHVIKRLKRLMAA